MSWESTLHYYKRINELTKTALGGLHSAPLYLHSVDFAPVETMQHHDNWDSLAKSLILPCQNLEKSGAEALLICTNTMHKVAEEISQSIQIPLLHIASGVGQFANENKFKKLGLLGTAFTMEQEFYSGYLQQHFNLIIETPDSKARKEIHRIIYEELCLGKINADSRKYYLQEVEKLATSGCDGVVLGCTEIGLLINQSMTSVPLIDTTELHCQYAVDWALSA